MDRSPLIAALKDPRAYNPPPTHPIHVVQTHISMLFFVDDRVYKVKKPVNLGFIDASTRDRRRHLCHEEVRLNQRLAPDIYHGVVPITRNERGDIQLNGEGDPIDFAVEMTRLPEHQMLPAVLERGECTADTITAIVDLLVHFLANAPTGADINAFATPADLRDQADENLRQIEPFVGSLDDLRDQQHTAIVTRPTFDHLCNAAHAWLDANAELLEQRIRDGRIREGHGDVHAGNICLTKHGIIIYDCIEFSKRFRCRDVAAELAFLAMDLEQRGHRDLSRAVLDEYSRATDDSTFHDVARFYTLHFAIVRAKVAALRSVDTNLDPRERAIAREEAQAYIHFAAGWTLNPALILMCGLPGTGKSHAARTIARPLRAEVLRTDIIRNEVLHPSQDSPAQRYSETSIQRVYDEVLTRAQPFLNATRTVIIDATFSTAARREPFRTHAFDRHIPVLLVEVTCPEDNVRQRIAQRPRDPNDPSEADWNVYREACSRFEPPTEFVGPTRLRIDSRDADASIVESVIECLIKQHTIKQQKP